MSSINIYPKTETSAVKSRAVVIAVALGGLALAVVLGYLIVTGNVFMGIAVLFAVPVFVLLHRYPWLAVLIWLFLVPLFTETPDARTRQVYWILHRALPPATLLIMLISSKLRINVHKFPKLGLPEAAMGGYLIVSIFSIILLNETPLATFYEFYDRVISPMCLYLLIRLWRPSEEDLKRTAPVVMFMLVSQLLVGLIAWYAPASLPVAWVKEEFGRTTGTVGSYGAYAALMIFSGLFLLRSALSQKTGLVRTLYLLAFILSGFGVFMSFSRGAWAAGGVVILGMLLIDQKRLIQVALIAVPLIYFLAAGPLSSQIEWANERLYSESSEQSALIRLPVFQASVRMLAAKPFFGWGYENFNRYDTQFYSPVDGMVTPVKDLSSHNSYLTLLAEQGLVGALLFLFPVFWWLARSVRVIFKLPQEGFWGRRSLILSWLFIIAYVVITMFHNMRVVLGLGLWWVGLALIANAVEHKFKADRLEPALNSQRANSRQR